ncbi:tRNA (N(6)-L-threonylcarbamoyladenosine(37)-C(2))-methylthiotransferase MtaB [Leptospira noumeaensis]|uniref:tRNA (N(6)-L-threonylcarbamoyladenosine(37)-C(2))-methylthiotransferase MtaB n=1 Tax=Leptospira noumeaensis TaxID=2484964 RepID=A0A4R9I2K3_9LEPT|nr:tRNA (N(6)-L-threonylcarbamoyladenosine(37)-C(2))-methylthiotransferase MtaB [Leptospira noumeaensis]TGK78945.1 tRNA (N(6)-L-threonylcarbamoyladenosine(37)-C(2))-methylthiotransferase MtaB [Leptospira noumeaensis]
MKIKFHTLGCRLNFFETDGMYSVLKDKGFSLANAEEKAEYIVVNTCTVTNKADVKNRNIIRNAIRTNPGAKVYVTGCYAETDKEVLQNIPGVFGVFGNTEKSSLPYKILEDWEGKKIETNLSFDRFSYSDVLPEGHTRAYLKIQDGCNRKCSYCKIPAARGLGVSRNYNDVLDQVRYLQDNGVGEIQLTGVNLGWYRLENGEKGFLNLLEDILKILEYSRIRLSSIEPPDVGSGLLDLMKHPRFCKFLHIPIQSGSRKVLKDMRRTYHPDAFRTRIELAKEKLPNLFLGTDVIVGFPSETESEFQETKNLLVELGFAKLHVFPYSVRKGTSAESFGDPIPGDEKKRRVLDLMSLSSELHTKYAESVIGKKYEAILESDGRFVTDNYLKGRLADPISLDTLQKGQFVDVRCLEYKPAKDREGEFVFGLSL